VTGAQAPNPRPGEIAELYLGNILFALERTAVQLDAELKADDAAFYRGIGRALADAHGKHRGTPPDSAP
jgi:hypothetical protein